MYTNTYLPSLLSYEKKKKLIEHCRVNNTNKYMIKMSIRNYGNDLKCIHILMWSFDRQPDNERPDSSRFKFFNDYVCKPF
jgi:hypothetical protein